ncbi:unnamed protein product [Arabis nemorensis]|uniref:Ribosome biogenesis protein BOP1 homolog n=1 Tax=Arabis nemorensis TaxID=586526 RepID=A0A565AV03_9BRAS|nr:unnamed protein product [Arabis nemorensis]
MGERKRKSVSVKSQKDSDSLSNDDGSPEYGDGKRRRKSVSHKQKPVVKEEGLLLDSNGKSLLEDEVDGHEGSDGEEDGSDEQGEAAEESDSSEDEVAPRNTVGDVPSKWYEDEKHIGYDITGKMIIKKQRQDILSSFLDTMDDSQNWSKIFDEYNDEQVELTKEERKLIRRLLKRKAPHADFDPYPAYVDWFKWADPIHPLSSAPETKRRFIPSKWEAKKVVKYVRAIRKGLIKFDKPEEELNVYLLWSDDSKKNKHLTYIPPPKLKLPGHEESYNPSLEYIPTEEEKASYELMFEEDRPKFIPTRFTSLRSIPAYENALKESFDRCLDLYLCPRVRKKRINIDPESLKPKLPSRKDLRPYPNSCYLEYKGHTGTVTTISTDCSGQWIASGSSDGSVRIWEVETGRCLHIWQFDEAIKCVAWNPLPDFSILAVAMGPDLVILNTELGTDEEQQKIKELLHLGNLPEPKASVAAIASDGIGRNSSRSYLFIATRKKVRVFNLLKAEERAKKLETGMREISSMAIHPGGDNLIVGSKEGKMCWFDMDLSSKPYKTLKNHPKDITNVAFHRWYPLFASSSEDSTGYVFHGKVYNDLNENPLIVPLEILRGHSTCSNGGGVLDCKFHPTQPWLFTAGADSVIKLYCH